MSSPGCRTTPPGGSRRPIAAVWRIRGAPRRGRGAPPAPHRSAAADRPAPGAVRGEHPGPRRLSPPAHGPPRRGARPDAQPGRGSAGRAPRAPGRVPHVAGRAGPDGRRRRAERHPGRWPGGRGWPARWRPGAARGATLVGVIHETFVDRVAAMGVPRAADTGWCPTGRMWQGPSAPGNGRGPGWAGGRETVVLHSGNMGLKQGLEVLVDGRQARRRGRRCGSC